MQPTLEPSAAEARTSMAWQRTALALGVLAALSAKLTFTTQDKIGFAATVLALVGASTMYVFARIRFGSQFGPFFLLFISAVTVLLLSLVAIAQVI